ncbi:ead/Ea22-like family protein [Citrobacter koseri]|uniref:ead/Ea22-like family protein n=1 Tax=Citrobacter koseri TaxID=545 RepID=UPI001907B96A|nr:ead/Ea22-like family protein [Citrobacter koseri]MBJ8805532.1 ead/Ea22-like family protein [Citrobacter koseri]
MSNIDKQALREAAEKATALNLDTAQVKRGNGGYLECPCCEGAGYVEEENDFCNIDGVALGVQFYGIGEHHGLAELYLRAANPVTVLALLDELEAAEKRIADLEAREVKLPNPHAHLIWIQAGHAPDDYWDDVAVSHSEKDKCCDGSDRYPVYALWEIKEALSAIGINIAATGKGE